MKAVWFLASIVLVGLLSGCVQEDVRRGPVEVVQMKVQSTAFQQGQAIPRRYTCDGEDLSPPLSFSEVPARAKSLAIIVDDPDAPGGVFDHWIAWSIPPGTRELGEGARVERQGKNGFGVAQYRGPCPPRGPAHRYFFKVYALDTMLDLPGGVTKEELEGAMEGHTLAKGELMGTYRR
ncbi:MAG: YbhB/YbcL family Raf kinase inhibitor-like protein [Candidatus Hydrothermarchaeota archaeon]